MTTATDLHPFETRALAAATVPPRAGPPTTPAPATFADQAWRALTAATGLTTSDVDVALYFDTELHVYTGRTRLRLIWPTPWQAWWHLKADRICDCGDARFTLHIGNASTDPATILTRIGDWLRAHPEARCERHAGEVGSE